MSIENIIEWIQINKKGCAFQGYDNWKINLQILESIRNGVFRFIYENDKLCGVVCGHKHTDTMKIYIDDILCTSKAALILLLKECINEYPGYTIQGTVENGRIRTFNNMDKLLRRLKGIL